MRIFLRYLPCYSLNRHSRLRCWRHQPTQNGEIPDEDEHPYDRSCHGHLAGCRRHRCQRRCRRRYGEWRADCDDLQPEHGHQPLRQARQQRRHRGERRNQGDHRSGDVLRSVRQDGPRPLPGRVQHAEGSRAEAQGHDAGTPGRDRGGQCDRQGCNARHRRHRRVRSEDRSGHVRRLQDERPRLRDQAPPGREQRPRPAPGLRRAQAGQPLHRRHRADPHQGHVLKQLRVKTSNGK